MLHRKTPAEKSQLDKVIDDLIENMLATSVDTPEYKEMTARLAVLIPLQAAEKPKKVSPDTLALIAANLGGIVLILNWERANVLTSKAVAHLPKLR